MSTRARTRTRSNFNRGQIQKKKWAGGTCDHWWVTAATDTDLPEDGPPPPERPAVITDLSGLSAQARGLVTRWRAIGGTAEAFEAVGWDPAGRPARWVRCRSVCVTASMRPAPTRGLVGWGYITREREGLKTASTELWLRYAGWPARRGTLAEVRAYCDGRAAAPEAAEPLEGL